MRETNRGTIGRLRAAGLGVAIASSILAGCATRTNLEPKSAVVCDDRIEGDCPEVTTPVVLEE